MNDRRNDGRRQAISRIGSDEDARMTVVDETTIGDYEIRLSDEALGILRREGVEAYERYINDQLEKK